MHSFKSILSRVGSLLYCGDTSLMLINIVKAHREYMSVAVLWCELFWLISTDQFGTIYVSSHVIYVRWLENIFNIQNELSIPQLLYNFLYWQDWLSVSENSTE